MSQAIWPVYSDDEIEAVNRVLHSGKVNYWTGGECRAFEKEFAEHCDCEYGIALANGTVALELALHGLGIGPGDEVIVPSRTFIATASSVVNRGAIPVFADVDPISQNITAETIKSALSSNTKAVIVVHLAGWPCDMDPIQELARKYHFKIIEDCAQAHGARYKKKPVGSLGDVAAFSFCQDKIMTTGGEGGMLVTNNRLLWEKAWAFKDHGKSYDAVYNRKHPAGFRWLHESFGTNFRLTEMQAAIGRIQLKKLEGWVAQRRKNAQYFTDCFKHISALRITDPPQDIYHSYYKYYVFINEENLQEKWTRDRIMRAIADEGVACFSGICGEIYREKAFINSGLFLKKTLSMAMSLGDTSLMFLVDPTVTEELLKKTTTTVERIFQKTQID
jgi:dTDP-4-amino-4,6-dideoxygalactose transaminase